MGIKLKNINKDSLLHKLVIPLTLVGNSETHPTLLSAAMKTNAMVPVKSSFESLFFSVDTDCTASNGYQLTVINAQNSANLVVQTIHSQITGELDLTANRVYEIFASANNDVTAGTMLHVNISGSVGTAQAAMTIVMNVDGKKEK